MPCHEPMKKFKTSMSKSKVVSKNVPAFHGTYPPVSPGKGPGDVDKAGASQFLSTARPHQERTSTTARHREEMTGRGITNPVSPSARKYHLHEKTVDKAKTGWGGTVGTHTERTATEHQHSTGEHFSSKNPDYRMRGRPSPGLRKATTAGSTSTTGSNMMHTTADGDQKPIRSNPNSPHFRPLKDKSQGGEDYHGGKLEKSDKGGTFKFKSGLLERTRSARSKPVEPPTYSYKAQHMTKIGKALIPIVGELARVCKALDAIAE